MKVNSKMFLMIFTLLIAVLLLSLGIALAQGEQFPRRLLSSGGGIATENGLVLHVATGQPVAGTVQNDLLLCSGYWCNSGVKASDPRFDLYLPAFRR